MNKTFDIQVRIKLADKTIPFKTIKRKVRAEQIGNFCPLFCTFLGKQRLVKSDAGDLSDPFRRDESYAKSFYIEVDEVGHYLKTCDNIDQAA